MMFTNKKKTAYAVALEYYIIYSAVMIWLWYLAENLFTM